MKKFLVVLVALLVTVSASTDLCHMLSERIRSALDQREYGYWNAYMGNVAYASCISNFKEGQYPFGDIASAWQLCNYIAGSFVVGGDSKEGFSEAAEIARSLCIAELWDRQCSCRG